MRTKAISLLCLSVVAIGVPLFFACDDETSSTPTDYSALLNNATNTVIVPENAAFAARADDLTTAAKALEATPTADTLAKAQAAWRAARAAYRLLDAAHFGPIDDLGIAERIDVSPATPAHIDAVVAQTTVIDVTSVGVLGGKSKGFLGMEYLIFSTGGADAALARLNGTDAASPRRRTLARAIAEEIAASAHQLDDAWNPSKGGYANEVINAGTTSKRYPTQRAALDDLVGGVGYALEVVVGVRLALPLGRKNGGTPDPTQDATRASDSGIADMTATLNGVVALYKDNGFAVRVRSQSAPLDTTLNSELTACSTKVQGIPTPFADSVTKDLAGVQDTYNACKSVKTTWNTDITSALGATTKPSDTDGD